MDIQKLIAELETGLNGAEQGLPDEVFSYVASVTPMVNVDLFVTDSKKGVLLAWRKDGYGDGWHIPGGIVRFKETFAERILRTAQRELGSVVTFDEKPLKITEIFMEQQRRGHFISFLFNCYLPDNFDINEKNSGLCETDDGFLKWHNAYPENLVYGQQRAYKKIISDFCR